MYTKSNSVQEMPVPAQPFLFFETCEVFKNQGVILCCLNDSAQYVMKCKPMGLYSRKSVSGPP